jgi:hypothetical protein
MVAGLRLVVQSLTFLMAANPEHYNVAHFKKPYL